MKKKEKNVVKTKMLGFRSAFKRRVSHHSSEKEWEVFLEKS